MSEDKPCARVWQGDVVWRSDDNGVLRWGSPAVRAKRLQRVENLRQQAVQAKASQEKAAGRQKAATERAQRWKSRGRMMT